MSTKPKWKAPASGVITPAYKAEQERLNREAAARVEAVTKRKPGRPPTGAATAAARQAAAKERLLQAGGRRMSVNLSPEAVAVLERLKAEGHVSTDREGIEFALRYVQKRKAP